MRIVQGVESWAVEYIGVGGRVRKKWFDNEGDARGWAEMNDLTPPRPIRGRKAEAIFGDVLARYFDEFLSEGQRSDSDACRVDMMRLAPFARRRPADLKAIHIQEFCEERMQTASVGTVQNDLRVIRRALEFARTRWGFRLRTNEAMGVKLPKVGPKPSQSTIAERIALLVAQLESVPEAQRLVRFAIESGMGRADVLALTWDHIDRDERLAALPSARSEGPKTVTLSEAALALLDQSPRRIGRCFRIDAERLRWAWNDAMEKAGISALRFTDLARQLPQRPDVE